jgi:peptidoglycan hydrolase-like protein with peptidoglycan-binding domain
MLHCAPIWRSTIAWSAAIRRRRRNIFNRIKSRCEAIASIAANPVKPVVSEMIGCKLGFIPLDMSNPGQPTISPGATGDVVRRLQRALRRTPDLGLTVNGTFDSETESAVKEFQQGAGLVVDGIVGPLTWNALPDGGPMPTLQKGSTGDVVNSLQTVLTNGAVGQWVTTPQGIDGDFGPHTQASVEAFQSWGGVTVDGVVGDQTWSVSLHAASSTLESAVGLNFVLD